MTLTGAYRPGYSWPPLSRRRRIYTECWTTGMSYCRACTVLWQSMFCLSVYSGWPIYVWGSTGLLIIVTLIKVVILFLHSCVLFAAAPAPEYWNKGGHGQFLGAHAWRARGARAYNGPAGSRGRAHGQEVESFLAVGRACNGQSKFVSFAVFSAVHYNKIEKCKIRAAWAGTPQ